MEFTVTTNENGGRITAIDNDTEKGFIKLVKRGESVIDAVSTQVPSKFGGQGIGKALIVKLIDHARSNGLTVIATCPFIKVYFEKNRDDVLDVWHNPPEQSEQA